jgi:hypothetical protein
VDGRYRISGLRHSGIIEKCTDADGDGYSPDCATDCDDNNAAIHPGASEVKNNVDDNCNGKTDEGLSSGHSGSSGSSTRRSSGGGGAALVLNYFGDNICATNEASSICPADCKAVDITTNMTSTATTPVAKVPNTTPAEEIVSVPVETAPKTELGPYEPKVPQGNLLTGKAVQVISDARKNRSLAYSLIIFGTSALVYSGTAYWRRKRK